MLHTLNFTMFKLNSNYKSIINALAEISKHGTIHKIDDSEFIPHGTIIVTVEIKSKETALELEAKLFD